MCILSHDFKYNVMYSSNSCMCFLCTAVPALKAMCACIQICMVAFASFRVFYHSTCTPIVLMKQAAFMTSAAVFVVSCSCTLKQLHGVCMALAQFHHMTLCFAHDVYFLVAWKFDIGDATIARDFFGLVTACVIPLDWCNDDEETSRGGVCRAGGGCRTDTHLYLLLDRTM